MCKLSIVIYNFSMVAYELSVVIYAKHFEDNVYVDADWVNRTLRCIHCSGKAGETTSHIHYSVSSSEEDFV